MRSLSLLVVLLTLFPTVAQIPRDQGKYEALHRQAEASYQEKSFARAQQAYEEARRLELTAEQRRWVEFRLADTTWRSAGVRETSDPTQMENARSALEKVIRESGEDHDRTWAEANESLGDLHRTTQPWDAQGAWQYYSLALDWWAGSDDLATARRRYLDIVFRGDIAAREHYRYGGSGTVPEDVLANAVAIAVTAADRAHAQYLLGTRLLWAGDPSRVERGLELLDTIIRDGKGTEHLDDALIAGAQRLMQGVPTVGTDGTVRVEPNMPRALAYYRRLVSEFARGTSPYSDEATSAIATITSPSVTLMVPGTFLPQSEQEVIVSWRNLRNVTLNIFAIDLLANIEHARNGNWWEKGSTAGRKLVRTIDVATNDPGNHVPGNNRVRLTPKLPRGAYVVEATAGDHSSRQLLLVTAANITLHATTDRADVFVCDAESGRPFPGARVRVASYIYDANVAVRDAIADGSGLATVPLERRPHATVVAAAVTADGSPAYTAVSVYDARPHATEWRIHAFTDRTAYRPGEAVQWKSIVRTRQNDVWTTPAGEELEWEITSPRGEKVASGKSTLNSFGTFSSELQLTPEMPLGLYQVQFRTMRGSDRNVGSATLFRLEEYKLPEFRVEVTTRGADDKPRQYRLGDTVTATIEANYYFGGPVANASVEVVVFRRPFFRHWGGWRSYPWYWQDDARGSNEEVKRETLQTDATGRAFVTVETSRDQADAIFTIEARVTDSSRREVAGQGTVRVTKHRYAVAAQPERYVHRPGDKITVAFKATDANDQPVSTTGNVTVVRRRWQEVWVNRDGREIARAEFDRLRTTLPPASWGLWRRKVATYVEEVILTRTVTTDAAGDGSITFDAPRIGYYAVRWTSDDRTEGKPVRVQDLVKAETTVWVTDDTSADLGYTPASGIEIVIDKESFRSGQTATLMIVTPSSGQWVLLTTDLGQSSESQVLHLDGTVKLVRLPLDSRHVPAFHVIATSILNRSQLTDSKQIIVPPVEHFIEVDVKPSADVYEPRSSGEVTITTRDVDGKPVRAEVALAVTDDAVSAIQADLAGDPRQFFFGELRPQRVQASASVSHSRYVNLVEHSGQLLNDVDVARAALVRQGEDREEDQSKSGGVPPPPPASAMRMQAARTSAVSEAITVAASAPAMAMDQSVAGNLAGSPAPGIDVQVRSDFRSTAFWKPDVMTGDDGRAVVKVTFPESLTTWRMTVRAVSQQTQVGIASATARTTMPLVVRLQAPRFFVEGDHATISAVINNNSDSRMTVTPSIEVDGVALIGDATRQPVEVAAHGETRADWVVSASKAGNARLRVSARTADRGDAMEKTLTVHEHGIEKLVARSGKLRTDEAVIQLELPHERRDTTLVVQVQPSLAVAMLDALPYLIHFPYGCTEQTMSRFLPAAIVARTLAASQLDPAQIEGRAFGGITPQHAARTHPAGAKSLGRLDAVTAASLARLYDFQHGDGGWGWWKEGDSDDFMTAYVVWGFAVAREGGLAVNDARIERAVAYLDRRLVQHERDHNTRIWLLHAIASWKGVTKSATLTSNQRKAFDDVFAARQNVSSYSRALLALTAHGFGSSERAAVLLRNLEDGVRIDNAPDKSVLLRGSGSNAPEVMATAHWGEERGWWQWHQGAVESTAFALRALLRIDPKNKLIEPATNWLVKNRRGSQWNNTRDTAIALLALTDYLKTSGELGSEGAYEVTVNGRAVATQRITRDNILGAPARFAVEAAAVRDRNEIRIRRTAGTAPLYFAVEGRFFSLEEPVKPAGSELFVRRDYFRMAPRPTLLKGVSYDRVPLRDQGSVNSGERVEVVLTVETKNDYEYLLFEDLKPAGLEATGLQSGTSMWATELRAATVTRKFAAGDPAGEQPTVVQRRRAADTTPRTAWVYQELRDRHVALFIDHLPQGTWEIRYTLRAEVPGKFHALPLLGQAMYVPEIRANGEEVRMEVKERVE